MTAAESSPAIGPAPEGTAQAAALHLPPSGTVRVRLVATIGLPVALATAIPAFARPQEASPAANPQQSQHAVGRLTTSTR
jgi:hypothetical protein